MVDIERTPLLKRMQETTAKTVISVGGSGSSKSWTMKLLMVLKFITEENKQFIITRKTMPALKRSSYSLIINFLKECGIYRESMHNKSDHIYRYKQPHWKRENTMLFMAIDEPTKIKSIDEGVNYVWM